MKKIVSLLLCICFITNIVNLAFFRVDAASAKNIDGFMAPIENAAASAIKISTPEELNSIRNNMTASYVLVNDIDMSSYGAWAPIGLNKSSPFKGQFDGQGFKITGLTVDSDLTDSVILGDAYAVGLFGVCNKAEIKNVFIEDANIYVSGSTGYNYENKKADNTYNFYAGIIAGCITNSSVIYNCHTTGTVYSYQYNEGCYSDTVSGGLVGCVNTSILSYSYSDAAVKSTNTNVVSSCNALSGGLVGKGLDEMVVDKCYNSGSVTATTGDYGVSYSGGIVGYCMDCTTTITDSFNEGSVWAVAGNMFCEQAHAGGIAGDFYGTIDRVYNSGKVIANANDPYDISSSVAYAGGICGNSKSGSVIKNSAMVHTTISASSSGSKYLYRISKGGTKSNNITVSTMTSGTTNDSDMSADSISLNKSDLYIDSLGWNFSKVWEMVKGKDYPQLQQIDVISEAYGIEYIQQHLDYIKSSNYSNLLKNYRWAQIYWSSENTLKSNIDEALYNGVDKAVDLINGRFGELFDDGNPYKIILADYVSDQTVVEEVEHLYTIELPFAIDKKYKKIEAFIKKYWKNDEWGELSDEDLFYLFNYKDKNSEEWVNSSFPVGIEGIVKEVRECGQEFEKLFGVTSKIMNKLIEQKNKINNVIAWLNGLIDYSAEVDAYVNANEEFKMILEKMLDNMPSGTLQEKKYKEQLSVALNEYVQYNNSENITDLMFLNYVEDTIVESLTARVKKEFEKQVGNWIESNLSPVARAKLKVIQWTVDAAWKICEYITKNGEIVECREMLRANAYFEKTVYNTLRTVESEFVLDPTLNNAYLFDAAFKFFKEAQIYSIDISIKYCEAYQSAWVNAIENLSNTFANSVIEQMQMNKMYLYTTYCHGTSYNIGGKTITVACPTDVYLYDSYDNLVVSIENNQVTYCDSKLVAFTSNAVKMITVPSTYTYSIKINATGTGKMSYSVSEYDDNMVNVQTTLYSDVSIDEGEIFQGVVNDEINTSPETYNLTNDSSEVIDNYQLVNSETNISVEKISFNDDTVAIKVGEKLELSAVIFPENSTIKTVIWTSLNENVATVTEEGLITGISTGKTTITAQSLYGGVSVSKTLTVVDEDCDFYVTKLSGDEEYVVEDIADNITLEYYVSDSDVNVQWFVSGFSNLQNPILIEGTNSLSYCPSTQKIGEYYYYARLTSEKYGIIYSDPVKINVIKGYITDGGKYSETINWELDSNNNLYIKGSGSLEPSTGTDFTSWSEYEKSIVSVEIEGDIQLISTDVFVDLSSVKKIKIGKNVTSIVEGALKPLIALEEIEVPFIGIENDAQNEMAVFGAVFGRVGSGEGVVQYYKLEDTQLSGYTYAIPSTLRKVTITNEDKVHFGAFYNCSNLTEINLNEGITHIEGYSFRNCTGLTSFVVPETVKGISEYALNGCDNIETITLPFIGANTYSNGTYEAAFGYIFGRGSNDGVLQYSILEGTSLSGYYYSIPCALKNVIITGEDEIPIGAFCNCTMLKSITFNNQVNIVNMYAFYNCNALTSLSYVGTSAEWGNVSVDERGNNVLDSVVVSYIALEKRIPMGDVNGDMKVNIRDATYIQKYLAYMSDFTESQFINADVNNDGIVSIIDATRIQMYLAHYIDTL